jgi:uncharacterized membrane protein SirB2
MLEFCQWLENTGVGTAIREGTLYFPLLDGLHLFGITIMFGSISMVDLRLLGWIFKGERVTEVFDQLVKWTWVGFGLVFISGILLFVSEAVRCYTSPWFIGKMVLVALGGVNAFVFELSTYKTVQEWNDAFTTPVRARMAGASSLVIWTAVITVGRFFAFL